MAITRIFQSGNSQAVELPKEFHVDVSYVEIFRHGEEIVLLRAALPNARLIFDALAQLPSDFLEDSPVKTPAQERGQI